jgi:hypothetical protein
MPVEEFNTGKTHATHYLRYARPMPRRNSALCMINANAQSALARKHCAVQEPCLQTLRYARSVPAQFLRWLTQNFHCRRGRAQNLRRGAVATRLYIIFCFKFLKVGPCQTGFDTPPPSHQQLSPCVKTSSLHRMHSLLAPPKGRSMVFSRPLSIRGVGNLCQTTHPPCSQQFVGRSESLTLY